MTRTSARYPNNHFVHANDEGFDWSFIEAAHSDRERDCQPTSLAQVPLNGTPSIEHFAPVAVPVLALPVLFCQPCGTEHGCEYISTIDASIGACSLDHVRNTARFVKAERVLVTASLTYTGRIERA